MYKEIEILRKPSTDNLLQQLRAKSAGLEYKKPSNDELTVDKARPILQNLSNQSWEIVEKPGDKTVIRFLDESPYTEFMITK